jgi:DNA-binding response OmpR family regulator
MNILIIDRDPMFSALLAGKIKAAGHTVIEKSIKNDGVEELGIRQIDAVFFDPSPMNDPKAIIFQIRRVVNTYPYLVLLGNDLTSWDGIAAGCNDVLNKPLDPQALALSLDNMARMTALVNKIGDEKTDFPSRGGVISKSAFNQLFRSAIDRVARYNELSHALFISIQNYEDIKLDDGQYAADYASSKLAQNLVRLRRQSDILGQTDRNEYALLLQRPQSETESIDAAKRFASALQNQDDITSNGVTNLFLDISLVHLPTGALDFNHTHHISGQSARHSG